MRIWYFFCQIARSVWHRYKTKLYEFILFCRAGAIAIPPSWALLWALTEYGGWNYATSDLVSVALNYAITFVFHRRVTYKRQMSRMGLEVVLYTAMVVGFYIANKILIQIFVEDLGWHDLISQMVISLLLTFISIWCCNRIFAGKPPAAP